MKDMMGQITSALTQYDLKMDALATQLSAMRRPAPPEKEPKVQSDAADPVNQKTYANAVGAASTSRTSKTQDPSSPCHNPRHSQRLSQLVLMKTASKSVRSRANMESHIMMFLRDYDLSLCGVPAALPALPAPCLRPSNAVNSFISGIWFPGLKM